MRMPRRIQGESDKDYEARAKHMHELRLARRRERYKTRADELRRKCREYRASHINEISAKEKKYYHDVVKKRGKRRRLTQRPNESDEDFQKRLSDVMLRDRKLHAKWKMENKDRIRETAKRYHDVHKDRLNVLRREYLSRNAESIREKHKKYVKAHAQEISIKSKEQYQKTIDSAFNAVLDWLSARDTNDNKNGTIYGIVYLFSNLCSDKMYVGQTRCLSHRYKSGLHDFLSMARLRGNKSVVDDIDTYGEESFTGPEIIAVAWSKKELDLLEAHYIKVYDSFKSGYNRTRGNIKSVERRVTRS